MCFPLLQADLLVLNGNTRLAKLLVGLPSPHIFPLVAIWIIHGVLALLLAAIGGYWLAGKALRPVKMITRTANEINATDLRRRLHLQRRDEFGELAATFDQMLARLEAAFKPEKLAQAASRIERSNAGTSGGRFQTPGAVHRRCQPRTAHPAYYHRPGDQPRAHTMRAAR
ncbi:MAG TPA: HAMP domain-containing protein [Ktedonobacteraceae bacterium]|nr:HAMP domain-containing protein [Ktedonobacteraceae bacterium]